MEAEFLKWAFNQGGLTVIIILLLFYIRKRDLDFKGILESNNQALADNARSNNDISKALDSQTRAIDTHSDALQVLLYGIKRSKTRLGTIPRGEGHT
jgi:hypothetical protein